jgi:hypothetical protein
MKSPFSPPCRGLFIRSNATIGAVVLTGLRYKCLYVSFIHEVSFEGCDDEFSLNKMSMVGLQVISNDEQLLIDGLLSSSL